MKFVVLTEKRGYSDERNLVHIGWKGRSHLSTTFIVINFLVWGNPDSCIDQIVDYLAEHAPGLLDTDYVNKKIERLISEGKTYSEAWEQATIDMIGGNCGNYISSETVHFTFNASRDDIKRVTDHWNTEIRVAV